MCHDIVPPLSIYSELYLVEHVIKYPSTTTNAKLA